MKINLKSAAYILTVIVLWTAQGHSASGQIEIDKASGPYPHKVHFRAPSEASTTVRWNFNDGSGINLKRSPDHVFWQPGTFRVSVLYKNFRGQWRVAYVDVEARDEVPADFKSLYKEMKTNLFWANAEINQKWNGQIRSSVQSGAWHLLANGHAGDKLINVDYYELSVRYLDALKNAGAKAVTVAANYPTLTPGYNSNYLEYIDYYKRLKADAKSRGLTFILEHNSILPAYADIPSGANMSAGDYYQLVKNSPNGKQRWGYERFLEAKLIMENVEPDYFVLIEEPGTHNSDLAITVTEWTQHIRELAGMLKRMFPEAITKYGAGAGSFEESSYADAWALSPELDFVETHMYPFKVGSANLFSEMLRRLDFVKTYAPTKEILMVEGWLFKASKNEAMEGAVNPEVFARDVFSFWSPLDQRYLEIQMKVAHHYGFSSTGPAWSRYLFDYLTYGDPELEGLGAFDLINLANTMAGIAAFEERLSTTGEEYKKISNGSGLDY